MEKIFEVRHELRKNYPDTEKLCNTCGNTLDTLILIP